jgi:hypothetical protein
MRVPRWEPRNRKSKVLDCLAALSKERRENPSHALMESIFERRNPRMIDFGPWLHRKGVSLLLWAATSPEAASCARRSPVRTTKPVRGGRPAKSTRSCGMPRSPAVHRIFGAPAGRRLCISERHFGWKWLHCSPCRSWDGASLSAGSAGFSLDSAHAFSLLLQQSSPDSGRCLVHPQVDCFRTCAASVPIHNSHTARVSFCKRRDAAAQAACYFRSAQFLRTDFTSPKFLLTYDASGRPNCSYPAAATLALLSPVIMLAQYVFTLASIVGVLAVPMPQAAAPLPTCAEICLVRHCRLKSSLLIGCAECQSVGSISARPRKHQRHRHRLLLLKH